MEKTGRQFKLVTQLPKPKIIGIGVLSVDTKGEAHFFENFADKDDKLLTSLFRTRIAFVGQKGIMLEGMEPDGRDRTGRMKFIYQEWWLLFT